MEEILKLMTVNGSALIPIICITNNGIATAILFFVMGYNQDKMLGTLLIGLS